MVTMENNDLLEKMFEYARALYNPEMRVLTAERYMVAVVDVITGKSGIEISDDEKGLLREVLSEYIPSLSYNLYVMRNCFMEYVKTATFRSHKDLDYFMDRIVEADEEAEKEYLGELTPEVLLECILNDPSPCIKRFIEECDRHDDEDVVEVLDGPTLVSRLICESFKDTESTVSNKDKRIAVSELTKKAKSIHDKLAESIYGQDNAINVFATGYFQAELSSLTDEKRTRPRATFLFAGPPGVGKTFLAKQAAENLGLWFMRFDMSEYSDKEATVEFCGSDSVYKNGKEGNITSFVSKHPKCILLFDEIEKANITVINCFLQILDAGRLRDNHTDEEVSFTDAILIFTTNAGKQLYENAETTDFSGVTRKVILKALQNDVNPETGIPYFPAAICSRFASGNVVMFNYIAAHNLREIAKREVLRHASNFEKKIGIKVNIDEQVYTALLFAEGGSADARAVVSRAETFFNNELFELFRLIASEKVRTNIENLDAINIAVELPTDNKELYELFYRTETYEVLVFSSAKTFEFCSKKSPATQFINAQSTESAKKILCEHDISFVLIDLNFGQNGDSEYLNIEDVGSKARDFFWSVREKYPDMPIYLLRSSAKELSAEEQLSFLRQGVRGVITISKNKNTFAKDILSINKKLHQQRSMINLARANKFVTFETAQSVRNRGKTAEIKLFDFEMAAAIDAEDSKDILSNVSKPNVRFDQVIGAEDAKKELQYFVEYLRNPKKYMETGVSAPKGVLLYGPPGTGKTMLAKAMASESDVTFITAEGNQFLNKYVGEGPNKVHELFRTARKYAPAILFIDEIDAIAKERKGGDNSEGVEATLTAFLTEMDGFKNNTAKPVFVLAATNFDVESGRSKSLDPALMRRFDRRVYIDLPTRDERIKYIRSKIAERSVFELSEDMINNIAVRSTAMSLAELESIIELSLRTAIRDGDLKVTDAIFEEAFETFNGGEAKKWEYSQLERIARHEAGHAFLCWQSGETPSYVTIVARGDHGGYMQHDYNEGKVIYTKDELLAKIRTSLGGRASEIVYYGDKDGVSTGAGGDLISATNIARRIICTYGMDEEFGLAVVDAQSTRMGELSSEVRIAVNKILSDEMKTAIKLIEEGRCSVDALVGQLMAKNHLTGHEICGIFQSAYSGKQLNR